MALRFHSTTKELGETLVVEAWELGMPISSRGVGYSTCRLGHIIIHPKTGECAWMFDDSGYHVHPECDGTELSATLRCLVLFGKITKAEADEVVSRIMASKGSFRTIEYIAGNKILPNVKTMEEMEAEGWFEVPETVGGEA